jgi:NifU-like protein
MWEYSDKTKEYFENPRNVGEIPEADGVGEVGSITCGDALKLTLKIENDRIVDAKFKTFGCASAIASSSALTEMVKGLTVAEAEKLTNKDIIAFLGGLPKEKIHCSVMGAEALEAALRNYRGLPPVEDTEGGELVCECFGVTDRQILKAIRDNGLTTIEEVTGATKAGGGCESCHEQVQALIDQVLAESKEKPIPKKLTNLQKIKMIEEVFQKELRPALKSDGGDLELIDVEGDKVLVALRGMCTTCAFSEATLKDYVQGILREKVTADLQVEEVKE